ncbi:glycosyltransferase [Halovulum dunhuangense]|uniref:Glycosyltransferase n=1 Tax=Halovulum dunhuangense TaxID=1505036 RepID=A0A849L7A7_9RHOB|nr:glycosyltransferase [Halovulum dunhuangense]NNU81990.1 glycosyltransferase [Halovulum dunhuangense]
MSTPPPRVAVLMATHNGGAWVGAQLESILASEGVAVHVFVSDDNSTDRTLEVARHVCADRMTLLPARRHGSAARNFFRLLLDVDWSDFDHVALADQDDIWRADKLHRAVGRIRAGGLDAYSSDITAFWPDGRRRYIRKSQPQRSRDHLFESGGPGNTFVLPRASADFLRRRLRATDPALLHRVDAHDWLIYAILREAGMTWGIDRFPGLDYRQHAVNVMGAATGIAALRKRLGMIRSGWYLDQVRLIADIAGARGGPVIDYVRDPRPTRLWVPLVHFRSCRRRLPEALMLLLILLDAGIRRNGADRA